MIRSAPCTEWAERRWIRFGSAVGGSYHDLPGTFTLRPIPMPGSYTNIATAYAEDNEGNKVNDTDTKTVTVNDVKPIIELIKTADPLSRFEPGGLFAYTYRIYNKSVEPVYLTKVYDDVLGTLYEWTEGMDKIWIPVGKVIYYREYSQKLTPMPEHIRISVKPGRKTMKEIRHTMTILKW
jgi:hypothetical protein